MHLPPRLSGGLGCCPFWGGGSVVGDLLFGVLRNGCGGSVFCLCFVVRYFVSFLVLKRKRKLAALLLLYNDLVTVFCICSLTLTRC